MACQCQTQGGQGLIAPDFQQRLMEAGNESLMFFVQGVKVGLSIKASEQQKWTRLAVIMGLTFGVISFMKHVNE